MLDFLTKYFAVLSAGVIAVGSSLVVIFIYGYLAVFDWNLIWIIEYQDITKFTLIVVALGITIVPQLSNFGAFIDNLRKVDQKSGKLFIIIGLSAVIGLGGLAIWSAYRYERSTLEYYVTLWAIVLITIVLIPAWIRILSDWINKTRLQQAQLICSLLVFVLFFGRAFGLYVRDVSNSQQDVTTNGETLTDQKVVILLSHHSVFYKDGTVTVVPSADIKKIVWKPTPGVIAPIH